MQLNKKLLWKEIKFHDFGENTPSTTAQEENYCSIHCIIL